MTLDRGQPPSAEVGSTKPGTEVEPLGVVGLDGPVVYTAGVFDLLHRGHVRVIQRAAALGRSLIVAVSTDELVLHYKGRAPVVGYEERVEIVRALQGVDVVVPQTSRDKYEAWDRLRYDIWAVGDDWHGNAECMEWERRLGERGVKTVYLPYTADVSSSERRVALDQEMAPESRR